LGDTKDTIDKYVSSYLKPMSPTVYVPFILLMILILVWGYQMFSEKKKTEEQMEQLANEKNELEKRLNTYIDSRITTPTISVSSSQKEDKLVYLQSRMETFVKKELFVKGVQLYEYGFYSDRIHVKRVVEFVDGVTSWYNVTLSFNPCIYSEFEQALQRGELGAYLIKTKKLLDALKPEEINDNHIFQFILLNVGNHLYQVGNNRVKVALKVESEIYRHFQRCGIIEAIVYQRLIQSEDHYFYSFDKKFGDLKKLNRSYCTIPYSVDNVPHIMLITFDWGRYHRNKDDLINEKVENLLTLLESGR
jgi:hypothetical protein